MAVEIFLRNCLHSELKSTSVASDATKIGYALKCDQISVTYAKTPIQVPIPQNDPQIIDLGIYRPSLSLSGLIETVGGNPSNSITGFEGMASFEMQRTTGRGSHAQAKTYYFPTKNKLEDFCSEQVFTKATPMEVEIGDASYPVNSGTNLPTGGSIYEVALQQFRVQLDATKEDRYTFTMQFVVGARLDS
jgi:hypothetical protein|tara:strand:+ start:7261 stop:7830 length:570 start_codon:yes stop_codon:yes gene_type:complete